MDIAEEEIALAQPDCLSECKLEAWFMDDDLTTDQRMEHSVIIVKVDGWSLVPLPIFLLETIHTHKSTELKWLNDLGVVTS
eukprot:jgi/Picsp_1/177/NSC_00177-R1_---NA---